MQLDKVIAREAKRESSPFLPTLPLSAVLVCCSTPAHNSQNGPKGGVRRRQRDADQQHGTDQHAQAQQERK